MAMNVNSALSAYSNYRHDYRTAKASEKKEDTAKTTGSGNTPSSMTDDMLGNMGITKFGISFNSDGSTTFFVQLEKLSAAQKDHTEKLQQKKATVQAASMEDLLEKIKNIDWNTIKAEEPPVGSRMDYSV